MTTVLELLLQNARHTNAELAQMLNTTEDVVAEEVARLESSGAILGYTAIVDQEKAKPGKVAATIEIKISPERGGGFDRLALRIANFPQVKSCYLMSGGYDLLAIVEGTDLREVARFISERLATMNGVLSTATHFQLKTYKENGHMHNSVPTTERLPVTP